MAKQNGIEIAITVETPDGQRTFRRTMSQLELLSLLAGDDAVAFVTKKRGKRRGRPKGSKNKPKPKAETA